MVSTFSRANNAALRQGFASDMRTYLVVSGDNLILIKMSALHYDLRTQSSLTGIWSASFYFGNFLGGTVSGVLVDSYGFPSTSTV